VGVKDDLLAIPERESGGQTAYDRFEFQTAWGLSRLLELHEAGKNYAVAFEFHDDIVTLDDAEKPVQATFYQVKTKKTGAWSFSLITNRKKVKEKRQPSFAGKMYDNFLKFGANVDKLVFVSNQPLSDVVTDHGEKCFSKAKAEKINKFKDPISEECDGFQHPDHTKLFYFLFSDLNLTNYEDVIVGKIASFLEKEIGAHIPTKPFAYTLNDICRKKSKRIADLDSFEQLQASKFVTRTEIAKWVKQASDLHEQRPDWGSVSPLLNGSLRQKIEIERAWREYSIEVRARKNSTALAFSENVRAIMDPMLDKTDDLNVLVSSTINQVRPLVQAWKADATDAFVTAVMLYEIKL
jgi:hypothetical protein